MFAVVFINKANLMFQGHVLLIGVSGAGKTTLSRFVAWMNGLSVFQVKVSIFKLFEQLD